MSTATKIAIQGPGLKKQGIVVLQSFFIGFFTFVELWLRSGVGILTGAMILLSFYGALRFGRPGTTYVSVVTPPLAFAANALFWVLIFDGLDHHALVLISLQPLRVWHRFLLLVLPMAGLFI